MNAERKLIQLFKNFVDRVFLPQIKKVDGQLFQWNKFSSMISVETINYDDLQNYVDSVGQTSNLPLFEKKDQLASFKAKKDQSKDFQNNQGSGFNPSKTFGGDRARMMFPLKNDIDDFTEQKKQFGSFNSFGVNRQESFKKTAVVNPQVILPGLERLCKTFLDNQQRIENILNGNFNQPQKYY